MIERIDSISREIVKKVRLKKLNIILYPNQTRWDSTANENRLGIISLPNFSYALFSLKDTKESFSAEGRMWGISDLNHSRLRGVYFRLRKINEYLETGKTKGFKRWFYAMSVISDTDVKFKSFISGKKETFKRGEIATCYGYYHNPKFGKKELIYFQQGFTKTYVERCAKCGEYHSFAYEDKKYKKIEGWLYCKKCMTNLNYGICDLTSVRCFRKRIEFTNEKDRVEVLTKLDALNTKKKVLNVSRALCERKGISFCNRCGSAYIYNGYTSYCGDCTKGEIKSYSDKNFQFLNTEGENPKTHFGFELETELNGDTFKTVYEINDKIGDLVKIKGDGSLNHGFEIVSNALSLKKFEEVKGRFDRAFKKAVKNGCYSQRASTTGLHVHISRKGFKNVNHLARFCQAWYLNKKFTRYVSERDFGQYREWNSYIETDREFFKDLLDGNLYTTHDRHERYRIVNLNNKDTVEIRCFKGILSIDYVSNVIELCELIKEYTEQVEAIKNKEMLEFILSKATRKLKGWIKFFLIQNKYAPKEAVCA